MMQPEQWASLSGQRPPGRALCVGRLPCVVSHQPAVVAAQAELDLEPADDASPTPLGPAKGPELAPAACLQNHLRGVAVWAMLVHLGGEDYPQHQFQTQPNTLHLAVRIGRNQPTAEFAPGICPRAQVPLRVLPEARRALA